jgi:hypothetical protein
MVIFRSSFWITFTERVVHSLGDLHGGVLLTARGLRLRRIRIDEGPVRILSFCNEHWKAPG